jgi:SAM-dependent methyltransferase
VKESQNIADLVPPDFADQADDWYFLRRAAAMVGSLTEPVEILDLGAGAGESLARFSQAFSGISFNWKGVDIGDSPEVLGRSQDSPPIKLYNGLDLPFQDGSFDIVWCKQVLEHVRYPDRVIREVSRVLRPGALFLGSVSQLEPFHSRSIFNWTHYGLRTVLSEHKIELIHVAPGVDGLTLMLRTLFGHRTGLNEYFRAESPFMNLIRNLFMRSSPDAAVARRIVMERKLAVAGHLHFAARRSAEVR